MYGVNYETITKTSGKTELWGVSVLELNSHPEHKGAGPAHLSYVLRLIPFIDPNHTS